MLSKLIDAIRDVFLFCVLIALVQIAVEHNMSFLAEHKQSIIHELDRTFIDQLYTAQRQLHSLEEHPDYGITYEQTIADLKFRLSCIEEQYKKNSPGLAFLGPIGTAAIITKEEKLNKKLLILVNEISMLLQSLHSSEICAPVNTIDNALAYNKDRLKTIIA